MTKNSCFDLPYIFLSSTHEIGKTLMLKNCPDPMNGDIVNATTT